MLGPLSDIKAHRCSERGQVQQLINDLTKALRANESAPGVYQKKIDAVVEISQKLASTPPPQTASPKEQLSDDEINILRLLAKADGERIEGETIATTLGLNLTQCRYYLHKLNNAEYISSPKNLYKAFIEPGYCIWPKGREYLVLNNLLPLAAKDIKPRNVRP